MKPICSFSAFFLIAAVNFGDAWAHQPWVLTEDARIAPGRSTAVMVYFGHAFPSDDLMDAERLAGATIMGPVGAAQPLEFDAGVPFATPVLEHAGTFVIGIEQHRGYWTTTPEGGRRLPRSQLDDAVHCSYSGNAAKTLVRVVGVEASAVDRALGHRLEILPQTDPTGTDGEQDFTVRVLFEGKAHAGPLMAYNADSGEEPYLTTETDGGGLAEIELTGSGPWMLVARAERAYPDPAVCDVESFYASLTFNQGT